MPRAPTLAAAAGSCGVPHPKGGWSQAGGRTTQEKLPPLAEETGHGRQGARDTFLNSSLP